uniref:Uncharacterized protein n=1 Tax=Chrysotila carterae TaxID=13221 RepID=A0A7S4BAK4_CHRCT
MPLKAHVHRTWRFAVALSNARPTTHTMPDAGCLCRYFNPPDEEGEDYKGGRSLSDLKKFAAELGPGCSVDTMENCSDEQKAELQTYIDMSAEDRAKMLEDLKTELKTAEEKHDTLLKELQATYKESMDKVEALKESSAPKIKLLKAATPSAKKEAVKVRMQDGVRAAVDSLSVHVSLYMLVWPVLCKVVMFSCLIFLFTFHMCCVYPTHAAYARRMRVPVHPLLVLAHSLLSVRTRCNAALRHCALSASMYGHGVDIPKAFEPRSGSSERVLSSGESLLFSSCPTTLWQDESR